MFAVEKHTKLKQNKADKMFFHILGWCVSNHDGAPEALSFHQAAASFATKNIFAYAPQPLPWQPALTSVCHGLVPALEHHDSETALRLD